MPETEYTWLHNREILSFEEISALVDVFVALGVNKVRLTGGEPLLRRNLPTLVRFLADKNLSELALTTNGVLLADAARPLKDAGLNRLTVSLDTLKRARFLQLTKRDGLEHVLHGIEAALREKFDVLKFDTVLIKGKNDDEIEALISFAQECDAEIRFIEYMDVGGATHWRIDDVVSGKELLERLRNLYGPLTALPERGSAPAQRFRLPSGQHIGIIASTTQPFCNACDRARLTADGRLFTCLYAHDGVDLKTLLRQGASVAELKSTLTSIWSARGDRGAQARLELRHARQPFASATELKTKPHWEMHTKGG